MMHATPTLRLIRAHSIAIALVGFSLAVAAVAQSEGRGRFADDGALTFRPIVSPAQPVQADADRIWKQLEGTYEATTPAGNVRLVLKRIAPSELFAQTTGALDNEKLLERGYFHVYGFQNGSRREVAISYRPETIGRRYSCGFIGTPEPDGFQVETNGSDCSFPLRRSVSQWKLEERGGQILVTDMKSGDVLRLVKVSAT